MQRWRFGFFALFLICLGATGYSFYLEYQAFLKPCSLCLLQRIILMANGIIALLAALFPLAKVHYLWPIVLSVVSTMGSALAIRHLQIQYWTENTGPVSCSPGLQHLLETQPFLHVLKSILIGEGDCSTIDWQFLGLSLPFWTLCLFIAQVVCPWWIHAWEFKKKRMT